MKSEDFIHCLQSKFLAAESVGRIYFLIIFSSGQLPIDPATSELITDSIEKATLQSLKNNLGVIEKAGGSKETILKVNIFLKDMADFQKVNAVYEEFFGDVKPARSCVEVAKLPKDALIEIESISYAK